jgi:hypothetical protein
MCIDIAEGTLRREPGPVGLAALFHGLLSVEVSRS